MAELEEHGAPEVDLSHYLQVFSRRRWILLACFVIVMLGTAVYVYTAKPVFSATSLILIEKENRNQSYTEGMMVETTADDYYQTQYKLLTSRSLLKKVYAKLSLEKTRDFKGGIGPLAKALSVDPVRRSRLVHVTAESHDPQLAAKVSNAVSETFVAENIESKLFISKDIMEALFPQLSAEKNTGSGINYDSLPAVVNSPLIQNLKGLHASLEAKWGDLSRRYTREHPELVRLKSQMEALENRIQTETRKIVEGMRAELSGRLLGNNIRVIDPAEVPGSPSKPRKTRAMILAAILGILFGGILALGIDAMDQTVHTQEDIERKLGLDFLGSVPMAVLKEDTAKSYLNLISGPKSFTGEALKNIRTMIGFAAAGKDLRTMLITSTSQGEGKTFIAVCLAMVFSQLGERVLLIEGDLRRPNLHKRFGISSQTGVSHFLAHGKSTDELEKLIQFSGTDNLDVFVCGHIPPNPAELLSTPKVLALVQWAKTRYDRIIIDGTPIFPVTDALLWSNHTDTGIFVVKFGSTNANLAVRAREKLGEGKLKLAGAVVNQVTAKAHSYGDYYYYYYYHSEYAKSAEKSLQS